MTEKHNIKPIYNSNSEILILGSFPSVKSRESNFYYGHPQNRFWQLLSILLNSKLPTTVAEKKALLVNNKIALWDVIQECDIEGSSDSSIKIISTNKLEEIFDVANIKNVFANGASAWKLYMQFCYNKYNKDITKLPSTSPRNARYNISRLIETWKCILPYLSFASSKVVS